MKTLVIGSGGREHALAWRLEKSESVPQVALWPGNGGTAGLGWNLDPALFEDQDEAAAIIAWQPDLVVIGPEAPLVDGLADKLRAAGLAVFGPGANGAKLEGSKIFAKDFMLRHGIPTADSRRITSEAELIEAMNIMGDAVVLKADGLAAGKGVLLPESRSEALEAGAAMLSGASFGEAGQSLLLEERLDGYEVSLLAILDGENYYLLPASQDHKRALEGDRGPNTGGMGAYAPVPGLDEADLAKLGEEVFGASLKGLATDGIDYRGVLYAGLMMTPAGPKVLEFNVRFGDPETQALMLMLEGDFGTLLASAAKGKLDPGAVSHREGAAMVVVLSSKGYPDKPETGYTIEDTLAASGQRSAESVVFHAGTRVEDGKLINCGGRVLGVTAWGRDLAQAADRCYHRADEIHYEGKTLRRDIGWRVLSKGSVT
ncbi:phosphoribosylamine--glycine ligase [bacterium]|nr:phosphoribosylamine--glycine ligase [bacterium]